MFKRENRLYNSIFCPARCILTELAQSIAYTKRALGREMPALESWSVRY